ncbi:MAG: FmdB family zinc ribbon protein [Acidimicrobiales bacterium]
MPTYEYRCAHCDRTFDVVQSFHDDPVTACPTCGNPVRKVFGSVGIVFKGSGFYKTDSRPGGSTKAKDSVSAATGEDSSNKSSDTSDSKDRSSNADKSTTGDSGKTPPTPAPSSSASGPSATP